MSDTPPRILIVRLSHLGDVVQTLPLYHALRAAYPASQIAWAVQPEFEGLLRGLGGLDRTILFGRREGVRAWPALVRALEDFGADWSVDAQANVKSAMVALASRAGRRSGYARVDWRERFAATSVTDPCAAGGASTGGLTTGSFRTGGFRTGGFRTGGFTEHAVDRLLRLARHAAPTWDGTPRFDADISLHELQTAERRLTDLDVHGPGVLLHLSPPADVRSWPIAGFAELARRLAAHSAVLVVSGPAEANAGRDLELELRHPRIGHIVGQRGLRDLAALFTACARRGMPFVGCDSGPMHLAWASGMRVVLLAGPQDERRTGPYVVDVGHHTVRSRRRPDCVPCLSRSCAHAEGPVCIRTTSVEDVEDALSAATQDA